MKLGSVPASKIDPKKGLRAESYLTHETPDARDAMTEPRITREEFDELERRVSHIEKALLARAESLRHTQDTSVVPGLTITPTEDGDIAKVDVNQIDKWTESQMIEAGTHFGVSLNIYKGKTKAMRDTLYKAMRDAGVPIPAKG